MSEVKSCHNCIWSGGFAVCNVCNGPADAISHWPSRKATPVKTQDFSATGFLAEAAETLDARGKQYDQEGGERSMGKAVAAFNIVTGRDLRESEGWLLLQLLKDVRDNTTKAPHADSLVDCVAYSALKAEARLAGK